jgi:ATP synthase protein I
MQSAGSHSGDLSHDSPVPAAHRTPVTGAGADLAAASPAAARGKRFYNVLSASSVGLEMGLSVVIGVLVGMWLDRQLGTEPLMMLLWLGFGFAAGFRGVLRAVRRADRVDQADRADAAREAARG